MIYTTCKPLVLASNSPRRRAYLDDLGLKFSISAANIDEAVLVGESVEKYVERMAVTKAATVAEYFPESHVLGADTAVYVGENILGKPADETEAVAMLLELAGKEHQVISSVCVIARERKILDSITVMTRVKFVDFGEDVAMAYVASGESLDKAGAYGIQSRGAFLVEQIEGSYSNVVGLPLSQTVSLLVASSVITPTG